MPPTVEDLVNLRPRDEAAFERARDELVDGFARWAGDDVVVDVAQLLLTGRFALGDWQDLDDWEPDLVEAVLVDWLPHAAILDDEYVEAIPHSAAAFMAFLEDVHLVDTRRPIASWRRSLRALLPAIHRARERAAADPRPGRQLITAMQADGVDLSDEAQVAAWIDDYNATVTEFGPSAGVRTPALDDPMPFDASHLRPFTLLPRDELAQAAQQTALLRRLDAFLDWIGDGRPVTRTGNLKIADGYELVEVLGTDDLAPIHGMERPRVTSAAELVGVDWVYWVALGLGWVTTTTTRLYAQPGQVDDDPLQAWEQVWLTVLRIGPLDHAYGGRDLPFAGHDIDSLDASVVDLLVLLHQSGDDVAIEGLVEEAVTEAMLGRSLDTLTRGLYDRWIARDVRRLLGRLAEVGVIEVEDVTWVEGRWGPDAVGGVVRLTPLGSWALSRMVGAVSPEERMADVALDELLDVLDTFDEDVVLAQLAAWARAHPDAMDQVVDFVRGGRLDGTVELGFGLLHAYGEDAVPAVRTLVDDPDVGALARVFLARHGDEQTIASIDVDAPEAMVDLLVSILDVFGPEALCDEVDGLGPPAKLAGLFERLWRAEHAGVERVLEAIGKFHPDKIVAKSARKALFKYRTARTT